MRRYSESVRSAVAACGAPYGYTLGIWTSGAPAFGNFGKHGDDGMGRAPALWGNGHVLSILVSYPASHLLGGYLACPAAEFTLANRSGK